jgi:hypothetical protein
MADRWLDKIRAGLWQADVVRQARTAGIGFSLTVVTTVPTDSPAAFVYFNGHSDQHHRSYGA